MAAAPPPSAGPLRDDAGWFFDGSICARHQPRVDAESVLCLIRTGYFLVGPGMESVWQRLGEDLGPEPSNASTLRDAIFWLNDQGINYTVHYIMSDDVPYWVMRQVMVVVALSEHDAVLLKVAVPAAEIMPRSSTGGP